MKLIQELGPVERDGKIVHISIGECDFCGKRAKLRTEHILNKSTGRCSKCRKVTHGLSNHPLYKVWKDMLKRCNDPSNKHYHNYGGLGVKVCDEWADSVEAFVSWGEANGYKKGLRIDKDTKSEDTKIYSPETCAFVTNTVNNRATRVLRVTNTSGYRGVYLNKVFGQWAATIKVDYKAISLGLFSTALEAAKAYDSFVKKHNLEHTVNGVLSPGECVEPAVKGVRSDSTSGYTGVSWMKKEKLWRVSLTQKGKTLFSKTFSCKKEAALARNAFIKDKKLPHKLNII